MSQPGRAECTKLAKIMDSTSHDAVNRFLLRESFSGKELLCEMKDILHIDGCILSIDDSVLDKHYSKIEKNDLLGFFYSGKHHKAVKGINLITLYCSDDKHTSSPINFRIYDKQEGKTKNEYFQEMVKEALEAGVKPSYVTGDCWYSSIKNLRFLREERIGFCFGLQSDRLVSQMPKLYQRVDELDIPENGLIVHLREFGFVKVFKKVFKEKDIRYYVVWEPENEEIMKFNQERFEMLHKRHWLIEQFHRAIKQLVCIEKFAVRRARAVTNHIYCSLRAFCKLEIMRIEDKIPNWYGLKNTLYEPVVRDFVLSPS